MSQADLKGHTTDFPEAISTDYRGVRVHDRAGLNKLEKTVIDEMTKAPSLLGPKVRWLL